YNTYIFDLDGTLLNTLSDLATSVNFALDFFGFPLHKESQIKDMVGSGVRRLIELAIPDGLSNPSYEDVFKKFLSHYLEHSMDKTRPYDGVITMLKELKRFGKNIAVVSNKRSEATKMLVMNFFPNLIDVVIGESELLKKKPAPDTLNEAIRLLKADKSSSIYIGDSDVDILTAKNCGIPCISVLWGFRNKEFLIRHGAKCLVDNPSEILSL
ncbi:MAG: HAD family hydrolase, partial [Prevotella sp.]|nr:HAD family hydrolase [Prevotella sp.]